MNLYKTIDADYQRVVRNGLPDTWALDVASPDDAVNAIRGYRDDTERSDALTRRLAELARIDQRATIVLLYALAPLLRCRLGRSITEEYRNDAFTELAMVILDSPLDGPRLAHRLVNRSHTRVYKAARRVEHRGTVNLVEVTPTDPHRLAYDLPERDLDVSDSVARRLDLMGFARAVDHSIDAGGLSAALWAAFRDHRLQRAVGPVGTSSTGVQRKLASRAAVRIQPLVIQCLHAA
jgi:hypothetical protein